MTGPQADRIVVDPRARRRRPFSGQLPRLSELRLSGKARGPGNYYINRQRAVRERKDVNETTLVTSARFILGITRKTLTKHYYGIAGHRENRYAAELKVISGIVTRVLLQVEIWHAVHCQTRKQRGEESTRALISVK